MNKSRIQRQHHQSQLVNSRRPLYPESKKRKLNQDNVELQIEEIDILKQLPTHSNIIRFVTVIDNDPENEDSIFYSYRNCRKRHNYGCFTLIQLQSQFLIVNAVKYSLN